MPASTLLGLVGGLLASVLKLLAISTEFLFGDLYLILTTGWGFRLLFQGVSEHFNIKLL